MTASSLRQTLEVAAEKGGYSMRDLTVLAVQNDPFRLDTPANHRIGEWLANTLADLGLGDRQTHNRGCHYMVLGQTKPDRLPYTNTDPDWGWLSNKALKAARWLGYIPFDQITDQRNSTPEVRIWTPPSPWKYLNVGIDVVIPDLEDIAPQVGVANFTGTQPYKLVFFGEKSSLDPVLKPIAERYQADLYLPTGEISDTLMYQMASIAADDGRPMVVFTFSDCDPAGWQMPISISRKLQAFKASMFPEIDFEVRRVALTPDQVREYGLPSTPLKESERRADAWRDAMGLEQTEIDALAALRPDLLDEIARDAIRPFYDVLLDADVLLAKRAWLDSAQTIVDASTNSDAIARIRTEAADKLAEMAAQIDAINEALQVDVDEFDLPEIVIPEAVVDGSDGLPLPVVDSRWEFGDQCRHLIGEKAYEVDEP